MAPAAFALSAKLRARKSIVVASLVALFKLIAAPELLIVLTVNVGVVILPDDWETAPVLVKVKLPAPEFTVPAKSTVPVLVKITLPPPASLIPVMLKLPVLTNWILPDVIFVALNPVRV